MASLSASSGDGSASSARRNDASVAVLALAATLALVGLRSPSLQGFGGILAIGLAGAACLPLAVRRRDPLVVFVVTTVASALLYGLNRTLGPPIGPTVALFFVAADPRTQARLGVTATAVVGLGSVHVGAAALAQSGFTATPILAAIVLWGGAWIAGDQVRQRRQHLADLVDRVRRAERETERERRLAAAEERTRIARDLHDSAAHAINVILVHAGGARLLQERDPAAVRTALTTIEEVARETIGEIDRLVGRLRDDPGDRAAPGPVEPPIGMAAAGLLAARHRAAGLAVELRVAGRERVLAAGLDQAAYRILQESLTNAARHGGGVADVEVAYGPGELRLTVSNPLAPGADAGAGGGGHGIQGMRERAALLGGRLDARREGGRFRVDASLPYPADG